MCGRYSLVCIDDLGNRFRVFNPMIGARSRFNIAPGAAMPVIVGGEASALVMMQWGLIPHREKGTGTVRPLINARAETLAEKPSFRHLIADKRCLVPASGYFEWKTEGHRKTPFYFSLPSSPCFAFAGLYDEWHDPHGKNIATYTIITTAPNALSAPIHNRMPAILSRENEVRWLSREAPAAGQLNEILVPYPDQEMAVTPVSPLVNNPAIDDERVIAPVHSFGTPTEYRE
jgi:putative SOS response-associated peptidase YedK